MTNKVNFVIREHVASDDSNFLLYCPSMLGRPLFLSAMSDPPNPQPNSIQAEPRGKKNILADNHKLCRDALFSIMNSTECFARLSPNNAVMVKILGDLKVGAATCNNFADLSKNSFPRVLLRMLHWGALDLDFTDSEFNLVYDLYYSSNPYGKITLPPAPS